LEPAAALVSPHLPPLNKSASSGSIDLPKEEVRKREN